METYYSFRDHTVPRLVRIYRQTTALAIAWAMITLLSLVVGSSFLTHGRALSIVWTFVLLAPCCIGFWSWLMERRACRDVFAGLKPGEAASLHWPLLDKSARRLPWPTLLTCFAFTMLTGRASVGLLEFFLTASPTTVFHLTTGETFKFFNFGYVALVSSLYAMLSAFFGIYACYRVIKVVRAERQITIA